MKRLSLSILMSAFICTGVFAQCSSSTTDHTAVNYETATASTSNLIPVGGNDIVDVAVSVENLSTLVAAVKAAGLVEVLKGTGPFTVFAPTNAAFEKLPAGTVEMLLKPENKDKLVKILTYHVVAGKATSNDIKDGQRVASVEGSSIFITKRDGTVMIDNARVVKANVEASNGIVHVIDRVIMPADM